MILLLVLLMPWPGHAACTGSACPNVTYHELTVNSRLIHSQVAQWNVAANNSSDCTTQWYCSFTYIGNAGGSGSPLPSNSFAYAATYNFNDQAYTGGGIYGLSVGYNITSGTSGSGSRQAFSAQLAFQPATGGETWTGADFEVGGGVGVVTARNLGGTSSVYRGGMNGFNPTCGAISGGTFLLGCSGIETDVYFGSGTSYGFYVNTLISSVPEHVTRGLVNDSTGLGFNGAVGAISDLKTGIKFGDQSASNMIDSFGRLVFLSPTLAGVTTSIASAQDYSNATPKTCVTRGPFYSECALQAQGITTAKRLTTDGATQTGFIYDAYLSMGGTGYTANPTVNLSAACSGAAMTAMTDGSGMIKVGIPTPGSAVKAECAIASISGTGSGATAGLVVAGNSLNFPINSAVFVSCDVVAYDIAGDGIGWTIKFGATMGATASTAAIVGSPSWTKTFDTGAAPLAIAAPVADTTLGAINITVTPSSSTWNVGGKCTMTRSARV